MEWGDQDDTVDKTKAQITIHVQWKSVKIEFPDSKSLVFKYYQCVGTAVKKVFSKGP